MTISNTASQTILFLAANPKGTIPLRLDQELRDISEGLQRAQKRDQFKIEQRLAVRPRDIQRAMLDLSPQIIHFSGHGTGEAGLVFEDEIGDAKMVDGDALAALFELFTDKLNCVVLNGCYSEVQAQAIAQHIPYVIGMNKAISDKAAIDFAIGFYDALGAGRDVRFAFKMGCVAIRLQGIAEHLTPVLIANPYYSKLEQLLKKKQWYDADILTAKLMLEVANREDDKFLDSESIDTFPCEDLRIIDQLWMNYSDGKLGFSIQKKLWIACGGKTGEYDFEVFKKFAEFVDWYRPEEAKIYEEEMWHLDANYENPLPGSLPSRRAYCYDGLVMSILLGISLHYDIPREIRTGPQAQMRGTDTGGKSFSSLVLRLLDCYK